MTKVFVALSGGVDSAVSAALLQKQGFAVTGVHMKLWNAPVPVGGCSGQEDLEAAKEVAAYLCIPFEVWDFTKEYGRQVVEYLFCEYEAGRTPNPDVMCNRHIKFGLFYDKAIARGVDFVATGHYAQVTCQNPDAKCHMFRGEDSNKDQSYFLWAVPKARLSKILFPVGDKKKTEVRALAKAFHLPNAERKDSQGVCFIGKIDLEEFLKLRIASKIGEVVTTQGQKLGEHRGAWYYTIGQRHGFGSAVGEPRYVVKKDMSANRLVVAASASGALFSKVAVIESLNWLVDPKKFPILNSQLLIQSRYRQTPVKGNVIEFKNDKIIVSSSQPIRALAPGQSMVLYKGAQVVGGGVIESAFVNAKVKNQNAKLQPKS